MSFRSILSLALASKAALSAGVAPRDTYYCTFYTDDLCENRSGSVNYATNNDGIFQNGGPYFSCHTPDEISLISYPPGDSNGDNPDHCHVFAPNEADACTHLDDLDFTTGDGGYYRITFDKTCPSVSKRETEMPKRNANYLIFYDDPACEQQSGSVHYSVDNQGCFENGGAYAAFDGGDDFDWHIEQYSGTGDYECTPSMEACVHSDPFVTSIPNPCVHLDSIGLKSGTDNELLSNYCS
ncbi:hypothetical protein TSTA_103220 [Talaromyces stipitatus ATCC 10500]|uniref:Uncharacterized protein n=1 Tax=Talaromyces stipitatus (strain ATCC 10500 / CBS 375.48 / QM 6759 / NRRL 1006) TaxID=441959 RepID=B8MNK9_TALSN|nr:uncharacterized protein TSTA_103220 [Talaromyces stipitatus ATCC 10500]EED14098.1 hypothetical protein TSTA_103220 [Talaromyces stipitatus ATCC 10500]